MRLTTVLASISLVTTGCGAGQRAPRPLSQLGISPDEPIEGNPVSVVIPFDSQKPCYAPRVTAARSSARVGATTHVWLTFDEPENVTPGIATCQPGAGMTNSIEKIGRLPAGRYVVHAGSMARAFAVLPPDTDPGRLDDAWRIQLAVAQAFPHGECFGMPGLGEGLEPIADDHPRFWRQLRAAFPDMPADELLALAHSAWSVRVEPRRQGGFTYSYSDGRCCTIDELTGKTEIAADGRIYLEPPVTLRRSHVPC